MYPQPEGIHPIFSAYIRWSVMTLDNKINVDEFRQINKWFKPFGDKILLVNLSIHLTEEEFNEVSNIFPPVFSKTVVLDEKNNIKTSFLDKIGLIKQYSVLKTEIEKIKNDFKTISSQEKSSIKQINYKPDIIKEFIIVYNPDDLFSFVLENPTELEKSILDKNLIGLKEFCFFNLEDKYKSYSSLIYNFFHHKFYNNQSEINIQLNIIKSLLEKTKVENQLYEEKCAVEKYIKSKYKITNTILEKIKSSNLQAEIQDEIHIIDKTFRNRLSKYLKEMGLQKKRMADGIYYYGLRPITTTENKLFSILENN